MKSCFDWSEHFFEKTKKYSENGLTRLKLDDMIKETRSDFAQ